jgi:hypothetical protein
MTARIPSVTALALLGVGVPIDHSNSTTSHHAVDYFGSLEGIYGTAIQRGSTIGSESSESTVSLGARGGTRRDAGIQTTEQEFSQNVRYEQVQLDPQQTTALPSGDVLEAPLLVRLSGREIIERALARQQTEEVMEHVSDALESFLDQHGAAGILGLAAALTRTSAGSDLVEPLWWEFLRALGKCRDPVSDQVARRILMKQLNLSSGGRRSAAAAGLGGFLDVPALIAIEQRVAVEENRFVLATLRAHVRAIRRKNGLPPSTTV